MRSIAFLLLAVMACHPAAVDEDDAAASTPKPKQPSLGIVTAELRPATNVQPQLIGYATVLDLSELFASASQVAAADAQRQQAAAHLQSTNAELRRQRVLNADDHNISDRVLQETAAAAAFDAASVHAAEVSLRAAQNAAQQRWGATLANGVIANAGWAHGLANGGTSVLEVAFNGDGAPPATVQVQSRTARHLARTPRVNARLLRASHYYLVAPASEFPIGMTIDLHGSASTRGVIVPAAAVVWVNGAATVFVEDKPSHYEPHTITAASHVAGGYLDTSLPPGTRVVVQGAQQLAAE